MDRLGPRVLFPLGLGLMSLGLVLATAAREPWHLHLTLGVLVAGASVLRELHGPLAAPAQLVRAPARPGPRRRVLGRRGRLVPAPAAGSRRSSGASAGGGRAGSLVALIAARGAAAERAPAPAATRGAGPPSRRGRPRRSERLRPASVHVVDPAWAATEWTLARAVRTSRFWWVFLGYFTGLFAWYAVQVHQTKYLLELGFSAELAAYALGLVGLTGIAGQIAVGPRLGPDRPRVGVDGERRWASRSATSRSSRCPAHPARWLVYVMVAAQGLLGYGLASVFGAIPMELFQGARYSSIFAVLNIASNAGAGMGPWVTGLVYDRTGSYAPGVLARHRVQRRVGRSPCGSRRPGRCGSSPGARPDEEELDHDGPGSASRRGAARARALSGDPGLGGGRARARRAGARGRRRTSGRPSRSCATSATRRPRTSAPGSASILEGGTRFAPIDPEGWATARRYHEADPAAALAAFRELRAASLAAPGRRDARAPRGVRGEPVGPPPLGARSPRRLGRPRRAAPPPAGGHADAGVGGPLGAAPRGLRRSDPLPA